MRERSMDLPMASSDSAAASTSTSTEQVVFVPLPIPRVYHGHHHHHDHGHGHHHHHHGRNRGHHHRERIVECFGSVQDVGEGIGPFDPRVVVNEVGEEQRRGHLRARMIVNPFRVLSRHGERLHRKLSKRKHHGCHGHRRFKHGMMMRALISSSESFEQAAGEGGGPSTAGPDAAAFGNRRGFPSHLLDVAQAMYAVEPAAAGDPSSSSSSTKLLDIVEALHDIELGGGAEGLSSLSGGGPPCPRRHGRHGRSHHHHHHRHHHHQGQRGRWIFVHEEPALAATPVDVVGSDGPPAVIPETEPQAEEAGPSATFEEKVAEGNIMACED